MNTMFSGQMFSDMKKGYKSMAFSAEGDKLHPTTEEAEGNSAALQLFIWIIPAK